MSRPFTFRLERVQSLRERAEDQAREELARGLARRVEGAEQQQAADHAAGAAHELTRGALRAGTTGADLLAVQAFVERMQRSRHAAALELSGRDVEVEGHRVALVAAAREREVLDRLERRARSHHEAESARLEQGTLDEIALAVHRRARVAA